MDRKYRDLKTESLKQEEAEKIRKWYLIDVEGLTLGRLCTIIVAILTGKNKSVYTPNTDCGDGVILINTSKIYVSGGKENKPYYFHNKRRLRKTTLEELRRKTPDIVTHKGKTYHKGNINFVIWEGVRGMMDKKKKLTKRQLTRLKMFPDASHDMQAQEPYLLELL